MIDLGATAGLLEHEPRTVVWAPSYEPAHDADRIGFDLATRVRLSSRNPAFAAANTGKAMTLDQAANYADIFSALFVIGGIAFGMIQLSEYRKQRRHVIAAELMRTFYSVDLADAVTLIRSLPDHCPADEIRQRGPAFERAAIIVNTSFETMGLMVFRRIADYDIVEQLAGGMVVTLWRKLDLWVAAVREEQSQPSWAEWFQWLAELSSPRKSLTQPAHLKHKGWRP